MPKTAVAARIDDDVLRRVDEVAKLLGTTRSAYISQIITMLHGEQFNPMTVAQQLIEANAEQMNVDREKQ